MAERKKFKQKSTHREKPSSLEVLFSGSDERARVSSLVQRLSGMDGVNGLVLGKNRGGGNRTFYIVTRGGGNRGGPLVPLESIEQNVLDGYFEVFDDQRVRWNADVKVVTEFGLQRSRKDFSQGKGQILTNVWHRG